MENKNFTHLHLHSEYSVLDGVGTVDAYAKKASEMGFKYLALTDHGSINGLIEFQKACDKYNISPILGCEAYIVPDAKVKNDKRRGHILLLVKNQEGFNNLCRLLTYANLEGLYYRPRIDYKMLLKHCEGLVVSTACCSSFLIKCKEGEKFFYDLLDKIGEDLYCEVMPHQLDGQIKANKLNIRLAKKSGCKIIATNDSHYIQRSDWKAQEVLLAIQTKKLWSDPNRWKFDIRGLHLRSVSEMIRALRKVNAYKKEYLLNTIEIAEKCSSFRIPKQEIHLPRVKGVLREKKFFWELCLEGYKNKFKKEISGGYLSRLKEEYNLIVKKKFARYFLIVWELVKWCKSNDILVGPGRGSAAGSLIAFLLGITAIDPIKHGLLFSRFINEDRIDYPDIDVDFEHIKGHLVKQHLETMYGDSHIANVSSFNRMKAKAVIKDVSKVFSVPFDEVNSFTDLIEDNDEHTGIQESIDNYQEGAEFNDRHPEVIRIAKVLEGQIKNYSQHAAALIVSNEPLDQSGRCNLLRRKDVLLVNWEKNNAEFVGLMKLDALRLKLLSIFGETLKNIKNNSNQDIDFDKINIDDKAVYQEIDNGNTVGLFQLNTRATTSLIGEVGVKKFNDLRDIVALVRPGIMQSGMTAEYIRRKRGGSWETKHKIYESITADTHGVVVFQEQVMKVISEVAGLSYSTADKIRKIIGKKRSKKEFMPYKKKFIRGCLKQKTLSRKEAEEFWTGLEEHCRYSFNASHSVAYALLGYQSAWLKKYFPTEFICAALTFGAKDKKSVLIEEAYRLGLTAVLPKVGISEATRWVAKEGKLYIPFVEVRGIGAVKAVEIANAGITTNDIKKFFTKKKSNVVVKQKGVLGKILNKIGSYNQYDSVQVDEEVESFFDFRIVVNSQASYKKLFTLFNGKIRLDVIDKLLAGDIKEVRKAPKSALREVEFSGHDKLMACSRCDLRKECKSPVTPTPGKYNIVIIGEAPGKEEDKQGIGFVGQTGKLLWKSINRRGYDKSLFHITNICKCFPSKTRKPITSQIKKCSTFLKRELVEVRPVVILAFGNTSLQFFTQQKTGIMNLSGKVIWNEEYGAWVVWCLHPSAVLYNSENKKYFKKGLNSFFRLLKIFVPRKS